MAESIVGKLVYKITGDLSDIKNSLSNAEKSVGRFTKFVKSAAGAFGAAAAFRALVGVAKDLWDAYGESAEAEARLANAIKATGQESKISVGSIQSLASHLQTVTTYEDDATVSAAAMLQQLAGLTERGLKRAIPTMLDYAAAMKIDLNTAAEQMGKWLGGNTRGLEKLGIKVTDSSDRSKTFAEVIDGLNKKFGGTAEAIGKLDTNQLELLNNQLGDMKENLGALLAEGLTPILRELNRGIKVENILKTDWTKVFDLDQLKSVQETLKNALEEEKKIWKAPWEVGAHDKEIEFQGKLFEITKQLNLARAREITSSKATVIENFKNAGSLKTVAEGYKVVGDAALTTEDHIRQVLQLQRNQLELDTEQIEKNKALAKSNSDLARKAGQDQKKYYDQHIADAQAFIDSLAFVGDATKGMFTEIGQSLADGALSWQDFEKAAVHALGKIVYSLGDYLAAEAAKDLVLALASLASIIFAGEAPGLFASAAIKGAGAAAAYITGSLLQAYDQGGLVIGAPGVDQNVIRITTGEYVVNKYAAARYLPELQEMNEGRLAGAGREIVSAPLIIQVDAKPIYRGLLRATKDGIALINAGAITQ